jgi:ribosome maturation factor RimP
VIEQTVAGLGYELVDIERLGRGLLRVSIDRVAGRVYPGGAGEFITVDDCEIVTRQLQYALEVEGADYARLEVSSPGLDRPLRTEADFARFCGQAVTVALKEPFQGRKHYAGVLGRAAGAVAVEASGPAAPATAAAGGWTLQFGEPGKEQVLAFALHEVREARLVPVLDFKGRRNKEGLPAGGAPDAGGTAAAPADDGGAGE